MAVTTAKCFFIYTTIRLGLKLSLFQQFLIKVKHQQIKWYQALCIQNYKIKNIFRKCTQTVTILACSQHLLELYQKSCGLHRNIQDIKFMLHCTLQLLCKAISCPNSARCALRNSYRSSGVNYCSTWTKTGTLINFSKFLIKKFWENLYKGLSSYMQTHTDQQA